MDKLKKNFIYQSIWQMLLLILPLVTSPILSRALGAEGIGIYSYTYSVYSYFVILANLGIERYGVRTIAKTGNDSGARSRVFCELYTAHVMLSTVMLIAYVIFALFFAKYKLYAQIQIFSMVGIMLNFTWLFVGMEELKTVVIRDTIVKLLTVILIILMVKDPSDLTKYMVIMSSSSLFSSLLCWQYGRKYVFLVLPSIKAIAGHGGPMFLLFIPAILENIYGTVGRILLEVMDTAQAVGFYDNATKALISRSIVFSLSWVMMPRMAALIEGNNVNKVNSYLKQSTNIIMLLSFAFAAGTAAVAKEFAVIFWGEEFSDCGNLIMIMAMSIPFQTLTHAISHDYLIPMGKDKYFILSSAAGVVANIAFNLLLIPLLGVMGAAIVFFISETIVLTAQILCINKSIPMVQYMRKNCIYIFPSLIMFIIVRLVGNYLGTHLYVLFVEIMVGVLVFTVMCAGYWRITGNREYFDMVKRFIGKR